MKQGRVKLQRSISSTLIPLVLQWFLRDWWYLGNYVTSALWLFSQSQYTQQIVYIAWMMGFCAMFPHIPPACCPSSPDPVRSREMPSLPGSGIWDFHSTPLKGKANSNRMERQHVLRLSLGWLSSSSYGFWGFSWCVDTLSSFKMPL